MKERAAGGKKQVTQGQIGLGTVIESVKAASCGECTF